MFRVEDRISPVASRECKMRARLVPERLDPRTREELLALLEAPSPSGEAVRRRVEEMSRKGAFAVHAALMGLLLHTEMSEEEASAHWRSLCAHREVLSSRLGRDPGLRVAALDYFSRRNAFLARPVVVGEAVMDRCRRFASKDGLTGLVSPGHFRDLLKREVRRSERRGRDFSLLLIDLDDFSRVNAAHGRAAGDAALREVAAILAARLRDADVAGRTGGAHFALILPGTRRLGAFVVAERIRLAVEERFRQPLHEKGRFFLTLSCGVAVCPADGATREVLLERASRALDRARQGGGNAIVLHHDEKRERVRFRPLGRSLRVRFGPDDGGEPRTLRVVDLSRTGALLESDAPFEVGEEMVLRFPDPVAASELAVPVRVERGWHPGLRGMEGAFRVGVRFLADGSGGSGAVDAYVDGLLRNGIEEGNS